jgi:hypothetical protein
MVEAWYDPTNRVVSTDKNDPRFTALGQLWRLVPESIWREWVGLTDEERQYLVVNSKITEPNDEPIKFGAPSRKCIRDLVLLVEDKLKEKNT